MQEMKQIQSRCERDLSLWKIREVARACDLVLVTVSDLRTGWDPLDRRC